MNPKLRPILFKKKAVTPPFDGFVFTQTISTNTTDYNLHTAAIAAGWNGTDLLSATVTVAPGGVYLYPSSIATYGFTVPDTIPLGSILSLVVGVGSFVLGRGGNASAGSGGTALYVRRNLSVANNGTVGGGGGGGGSFGGINRAGGGGGMPLGLGGAGQLGGIGTGGNATLTAAGAGGFNPISGGSGGAGGYIGADGSPSSSGVSGGTAGKYLDGSAYVTWLVPGTRLGNVS